MLIGWSHCRNLTSRNSWGPHIEQRCHSVIVEYISSGVYLCSGVGHSYMYTIMKSTWHLFQFGAVSLPPLLPTAPPQALHVWVHCRFGQSVGGHEATLGHCESQRCGDYVSLRCSVRVYSTNKIDFIHLLPEHNACTELIMQPPFVFWKCSCQGFRHLCVPKFRPVLQNGIIFLFQELLKGLLRLNIDIVTYITPCAYVYN